MKAIRPWLESPIAPISERLSIKLPAWGLVLSATALVALSFWQDPGIGYRLYQAVKEYCQIHLAGHSKWAIAYLSAFSSSESWNSSPKLRTIGNGKAAAPITFAVRMRNGWRLDA